MSSFDRLMKSKSQDKETSFDRLLSSYKSPESSQEQPQQSPTDQPQEKQAYDTFGFPTGKTLGEQIQKMGEEKLPSLGQVAGSLGIGGLRGYQGQSDLMNPFKAVTSGTRLAQWLMGKEVTPESRTMADVLSDKLASTTDDEEIQGIMHRIENVGSWLPWESTALTAFRVGKTASLFVKAMDTVSKAQGISPYQAMKNFFKFYRGKLTSNAPRVSEGGKAADEIITPDNVKDVAKKAEEYAKDIITGTAEVEPKVPMIDRQGDLLAGSAETPPEPITPEPTVPKKDPLTSLFEEKVNKGVESKDAMNLSQRSFTNEKPTSKSIEINEKHKPLTLYRGYGRDKKESAYNSHAIPILGEGKYYSFSEKGAMEYGPKIEKIEFVPKNPLVLTNDSDWFALTDAAGWEYPSPFGMDKTEAEKMIKDLNNKIKEGGYDSVIVEIEDTLYDMNSKGRSIKTIRKIFGESQVYVPTKTKSSFERLLEKMSGKKVYEQGQASKDVSPDRVTLKSQGSAKPTPKKDALTTLFEEKVGKLEPEKSPPIKGEHFEINPKFFRTGYLPGESTHLVKMEESGKGRGFLSETKKKFYKAIPKSAKEPLRNEWNYFLPQQQFDKFYTSLVKPSKTMIRSGDYDATSLGTLNDWIKDEDIRKRLSPVMNTKVYKMSPYREAQKVTRGGFYSSEKNEIHLSSGYSPAAVYSILMHEAFHALQHYSGVMRSPGRSHDPTKYRTERERKQAYLESPIEREARAFERVVSSNLDKYRSKLHKTQPVARGLKTRYETQKSLSLPKDFWINSFRSSQEKGSSLNEAAKFADEAVRKYEEEQANRKIAPERVSVKGLSPQQVKNRKISDIERKKMQKRAESELKARKQKAEEERQVAFKALGIKDAKEAATDTKELVAENPDGQDLSVLLEEAHNPQDRVRAQAMAEAQHMKDKIVTKLRGIWSNFDVEHPFKAVSAPKTGRAVKLFYDTKNTYLEEAKKVVKELKELGLSKEQLWEAFLAAESDTDLLNTKLNSARDNFRDYFDKSFTQLEENGVLSLPWPQSAISRLEQEITDLKTKLTLPNIKKQAEGKIQGEIEEIRKTISLLKDLKYIPKSSSLITKALAQVLPQLQPKSLRRFAIAAHKKRTTGALGDWVRDQPEIRDVLHPYDFLGYYADKKGSDIALLRIATAAIDEGLASKGQKLGFKMQPGEFPALEGYTLHPALYEYLKNLINPLPFNVYDKISRYVKATVVFDPTYLGTLIPYFRTLIQNPKYLVKLPSYWKKAIKGMIDKSPEYLEFIENGGASNPFPEVGDFKSWLEKEKLINASPVGLIFDTALDSAVAKDLFNKMADFSWMVDRLARFSYYHMLRDKGFSVEDAAKLAAENFVDYNKLPAKTRRWVGRLFFAPATQILSIINDVMLSISPIRLAQSFFKGGEGFKNDNINKDRMKLLVGTIMTLFAIDALYRNWGFEREEFGTRYKAEYEDEQGKKKEVVATPTHALNYPLRWGNTFLRGFEPGESSPIQKLWGRLVGQINPVLKMATELGQNKNSEGKKIWDPIGDTAPTALVKIAKFVAGHIEPFAIQKFHTPEDKKVARQSVKDRMGVAELFMDSIQFLYSRKTERERVRGKIKYLKSQQTQLMKSGDLTEDARLRYVKAREDLNQSIIDK